VLQSYKLFGWSANTRKEKNRAKKKRKGKRIEKKKERGKKKRIFIK
jgi:hypothetical protein